MSEVLEAEGACQVCQEVQGAQADLDRQEDPEHPENPERRVDRGGNILRMTYERYAQRFSEINYQN